MREAHLHHRLLHSRILGCSRIRAIRPSPAGLEIEAEIGAAVPSEGVGSPILVLAMAPIEAKLAVGADIRLNANPQNAFVFPCLDKACQA